MNSMNLPTRSTEKPKWKGARKDNGPCENRLNQQFYPSCPNSVWSSDFTYIKVNGRFHYLCVVIDLFSRKIIGWSLSNHHDVDLVIAAFDKACSDRGEPDFVLFHSDQGSEYTSFTFRKYLEKCNAVQSFSKKGYPYDNACCESFFRHMKRECIDRKSFHNQDELRLTCFEYINRYNSKRPHSSLGYYTPDEIETMYLERQSNSAFPQKTFKNCVHLLDYVAQHPWLPNPD